MNPQPGSQGVAGRPNAPGAQAVGAPNRQQGPFLYRPEQMRQISMLGEEEKVKYEKGLAGLWKAHDNALPGSQQRLDAEKKISDFGKILMTKLNTRRQMLQEQQQQRQQQQQLNAQQQPQQQQLQQHQQQQAQQRSQQQQPGQAQAAPHGQQVPTAQAGGGQSGNMGNPASQPQAPGAPAPHLVAATAQARALPGHIISHLNEMQFQAPPDIQNKEKWVEEIRQKYARALYSMESARSATKTIEKTLQDNQSLPPDERQKLEERKAQLHKQYQEAITFANAVRKQYGGGNQASAQNGASGPGAANQGRPQSSGPQPAAHGAGNGAPVAASTSPMQSSTAAVNAAIEAAKKQSMAASRVPGVVNALPAQTGPSPQSQVQAPATPTQAQPSSVAQAPPAQTVQQTQPPQQHQQQPKIKIEPGTQPLPAPLNTAIAAAAAGGLPSAGTPTQNSARLQTPQSATPTTANANIRPLTHAAAVNLASQPRPGGVPPTPTTAPGVGPAGSGTLGGIGAAQQPQGHPHAHPAQQQQQQQQQQAAAPNLQSKLPIPKVLHEKAGQMPTPVPNIGGIGSTPRPTYSGGGGIGGGVMNQPALPKTPAFQLEGEGERILNKKKLDELVRQVCGGTAEGQEGNLLTPEVEESVLTMADSFVDNVLHQACRNAKERGSKVLEIRDLQLVLERTYNIRIPGYSSEELRTVRKVQPNSSWIKKMSAVQAAKVVPGKGDL
ncbi:hypothetical protein N658DRAFT_497391 [Parathielavia hyrcaniae]|uniref:Transcription initiation factor TFIID subunit 12 domain-containing protein n=1 Tax=Parathielavia hyrcaniae TaxID=113614 RepID=A0AAN6PYX9_9PEZI|nr:hypothetical protein N658DRAFT_497391 [Parathielavia hyrcaniae]